MTAPRLLVAGVGNVFFGDDGFGVEVVRRLAGRPMPETVRVVDFGIRGFDLACALTDGYAAAVLIDAVRRGGAPGTLYVIEPGDAESSGPVAAPDPHGLHPAAVLSLAATMGDVCPHVRVVGCEPLTFGSEEEPVMGLSEPVGRAVEEAVRLVEALARTILGAAGETSKVGLARPPSVSFQPRNEV